jgi:hypothetical protein
MSISQCSYIMSISFLSYPFNHVNVLIESFYVPIDHFMVHLNVQFRDCARDVIRAYDWYCTYLSGRQLPYFCASLLEFYASISSFREIKIVTQLPSEV